MRPLTDHELLDAWERGLARPPLERAITLLAAALPETPPAALADLRMGERDARLLTLRELTFGSRLSALADCPECQARLEINFATSDIKVEPPTPLENLEFAHAGYTCRVRLPRTRDLARLEASTALEARRKLLESCILEARLHGEEIPPDHIPEGVATALAEEMAEADPQADVRLALECPDCGQKWSTSFDILSYFWSEISAWASGVLRDVHVLASAYGWSEREILGLGARRRWLYLEILRG
jgi:hypothetical protein